MKRIFWRMFPLHLKINENLGAALIGKWVILCRRLHYRGFTPNKKRNVIRIIHKFQTLWQDFRSQIWKQSTE